VKTDENRRHLAAVQQWRIAVGERAETPKNASTGGKAAMCCPEYAAFPVASDMLVFSRILTTPVSFR
jgi:hypothetical protein